MSRMAKGTSFGEWLKIRRLAAELTPIDMAKAIGVDAATYRDIEGDRAGVTVRMLGALCRIDRLKVTMRDLQLNGPKIIATKQLTLEEAEALAPAPVAPKGPSSLDAILESYQAKAARAPVKAAKLVSPLGQYLLSKSTEMQLTRMELAKRCKVMPTDLDDIEAGFVPGPLVLRNMAAGLGIDPIELETVLGR